MIQLVIAGIIAALGFGSAWQIQSWRYDAREKERAEANLEAERLANRARTAASDNVLDAINAAKSREIRARADAAGARSALVGLSDAADDALRSAYVSKDAAINTAIAAVNVLKQCGKEYSGLAEVADRHAIDVKTLMDAWPKNTVGNTVKRE